jgi:hypothetical protein
MRLRALPRRPRSAPPRSREVLVTTHSLRNFLPDFHADGLFGIRVTLFVIAVLLPLIGSLLLLYAKIF